MRTAEKRLADFSLEGRFSTREVWIRRLRLDFGILVVGLVELLGKCGERRYCCDMRLGLGLEMRKNILRVEVEILACSSKAG